jgi:hypothetical protein
MGTTKWSDLRHFLSTLVMALDVDKVVDVELFGMAIEYTSSWADRIVPQWYIDTIASSQLRFLPERKNCPLAFAPTLPAILSMAVLLSIVILAGVFLYLPMRLLANISCKSMIQDCLILWPSTFVLPVAYSISGFFAAIYFTCVIREEPIMHFILYKKKILLLKWLIFTGVSTVLAYLYRSLSVIVSKGELQICSWYW